MKQFFSRLASSCLQSSLQAVSLFAFRAVSSSVTLRTALSASAGIVLGAALLTPSVTLADTPDDSLVMALTIDDIISLDPAEAFEISALEVIGNTYDRLISYDLDDVSKIHGAVARSWKVSEDGKTFTFTIRDGIIFASGNELTAEDAAFSLQRVVMLDLTPSFILNQFGFTRDNVQQKIRVKDGKLEMELDQSYAPTFVLYCLTAGIGAIIDSKLVMQNEKDGDLGHEWLKTNHAGSGPFALRSWKPNQSLSLTAHEEYWNGPPAMKRVLIRHVAESASQQLLLEKGDIDIARNLEADQLAGIEGNEDIKTTSTAKGTVQYVSMNQQNENLSKPAVREALKYLVDYRGIADTILKGKSTVHQAFLPVGILGVINDKPYELDVEKARQLLAKAGLPDGFKVTMDTRNITAIMSMAQSIQQTFAEAGVELEIIPGDGKQTLTKYRARQHELYIGPWGTDYQDPHSNADTFASNPDNADDAAVQPLAWRNAWEIPEMTKKTQASVLEKDAGTRAGLYEELQREHQKTSPFIIMFQDTEVASIRSNVNDFELGPSFDTNYYKSVTKD